MRLCDLQNKWDGSPAAWIRPCQVLPAAASAEADCGCEEGNDGRCLDSSSGTQSDAASSLMTLSAPAETKKEHIVNTLYQTDAKRQENIGVVARSTPPVTPAVIT